MNFKTESRELSSCGLNAGGVQGSLNVDGIATAALATTAFSFQFPVGGVEAVMCLSGASTGSSGSMPMISEVTGAIQTPPSSPFSAQGGVPPVRCRSQPTVLLRSRRDRSRASWKKHRRSVLEDDRPKLDFLKMTEVAYRVLQLLLNYRVGQKRGHLFYGL